MTYYRFAIPVASGDSTLVVRISTNNTTCGLVGKHTFEGKASQIAIDAKIVQITLATQGIQTTNGPDVQQPACPEPPGCEEEPASRVISGSNGALASASDCGAPAPPGGGSEDFVVCFIVWRELWLWDFVNHIFQFITMWPVGLVCYNNAGLIT